MSKRVPIAGLALSRQFFFEGVQPVLSKSFPRLRYSAALLGWGSEVLGYDDAVSRDHGWGPRLQLFLEPRDYRIKLKVSLALSRHLPGRIAGISTNFTKPDAWGIVDLAGPNPGRTRHGVEFLELRKWLVSYLGADPARLSFLDWLTMPQQKLLSVTCGEVFRDDTGALEAVRGTLAWYPEQVWYYLLRAAWIRVGQEETYPDRCAAMGDSLGARLAISRQCRDMVALCFIQSRRYMPYSKWSARGLLDFKDGQELAKHLNTALSCSSYVAAKEGLNGAAEHLARQFNKLGLTKPLSAKVGRIKYLARKCQAIDGYAFANAIESKIKDRWLLSRTFRLGSIDQIMDWSDELSRSEFTRLSQVLWSGPTAERGNG